MCTSGQGYVLDLARPDAITRLTDPAFANGMTMDKGAQRLLVTRSNAVQPSQTYLADTAGKRIAWVSENAIDAAHPYAPYAASHELPRFGTIKASDGTTLHWRMVTPKLEAGKRYPVFFSHYGGPHGQDVTKGWGGELEQYLVDRGYIWFEIDNRGSRQARRGVRERLEPRHGQRRGRGPEGRRALFEVAAVRRSGARRHLRLVLRRLYEPQDAPGRPRPLRRRASPARR